MNYHGRIFNLKCEVPCDASANQSLSWKFGHKQARHDAAEIAAEADKEIENLRAALAYAISEADGWHDDSRGGLIDTEEMAKARALLTPNKK